ncbi:FAD-binding protein [Sphingomonas sanguinis]|uniref:FAD-binding protein n=1 Tax=Sphingomonas sp. LC-1 TaxID=3110957 RepID=UPI0021BAADE6|nr:FAD-binding protein [Sphingomonas sp. LC-1]MCT8003158.1 FAD-binding protein [Sphingomonas sp. LC-1]
MSEPLHRDADVLVIGGSLAGAWAALTARKAGAEVVIVDKGWIGTAGIVAAATGGGYFLLPDDPEQRARTIRIRHDQADGLDDLAFCEKVYEQSYRCYRALEDWGFRFDRMGGFRGPDSMLFLRRLLRKAGVHILDHSPALELLADATGAIAGAAGVPRKTGVSWRVRAAAVILATGGNAFRSGAMGTGGSTGDGYLFAAEAGASAVGMEFSGHYAFVAEGSSCTKGGMYHLYGQIFDEDGVKLDPQPGWAAVPAAGQAMLAGKRVYAQIDVPAGSEPSVRGMMPNFFAYFERNGVEALNARWPVGLLYEGTVRAAGGLEVDDEGATGVHGLFAVGDVADKTRLTGAQMSGAGAAIAWCVASGQWAGAGAARFARELGSAHAARPAQGIGGVGVRATKNWNGHEALLPSQVEQVVRDEILPLEKTLYRSGKAITASLAALDPLWSDAARCLARGTSGRDAMRAREAAAMTLTARWIYRSADQRKETRGLHRRSDYPQTDPAQRRNLRVSGLEKVMVQPRVSPV